MASSQTKFYGVLGLIAIVGIGLIAYVMTREEPGAAVQEAASVQPVNPGESVPPDVGVMKGSDDAPVTVEEYADFQCPYCGMVAQLTVPSIVENYVETGQAKYIFYDFPVHPGETSYLAAEAARCAGDQGAFWRMHDTLFARMSQWRERRDPAGAFEDYAEDLGLDVGAFGECMDSRKYRNLVLRNKARGEQFGVDRTPTFIVNGRRVTGAVGSDQLSAVIEEELASEADTP